jgi:hypothetical protein
MEAISARLVALGADAPAWVIWLDAPPKGDIADYLNEGGKIADIEAMVTPDYAPIAPERERLALPQRVAPFPLETLPEQVATFVRTAATAIDCPPEFVAMPLLAFASGAIGTSACLEIKQGWREYARLWVAIVGEPGDRKTPAQKAAQRPLDERQKKLHDTWKEQDEKGKEPHLEQAYISDTTMEALGDALYRNPRGVALARDELSGWARSMNEYKQRGADRQGWLSLWSGASLLVNRRNRANPLYVADPFVSIVGGMQPDVLGELSDERGRNDGLLLRVLFVYPDQISHEWNEATIPDDAYKPLDTLFDALHARGLDEPLVVTFTAEARRMWAEIANRPSSEAEGREFPTALLGPWAKLEAYAARFALVFHLMRAAFDTDVDERQCDEYSLAYAAELVEYLKSHLRKACARLTARPEDVRLLRLVQWIRDHGGACTAREVYRAGVAGITTPDAAEAALSEIAANGWGKYETDSSHPGRATQRLTLYALTHDKKTGGEK